MKKALKWMGIAVLTPILLVLILTALLYFPPVQNWAVQKVAAIASEKTGMDISVGYVRLEWPLNLGLDNFRALHPNDSLPNVIDTIVDARHLTVDVQLWPLLKKQVVINQLALEEAKINTNGFISDLRIMGNIGELWLRSNGIDLDKETAEVNGARLTNARLDIALSDTAAVDTTEESLKWLINADSLSFRQTDLTLHLPNDTVAMRTLLGQAVAREARIDLGTGTYQVGSIDGTGCCFDYAPIGLADMTLGIDQFSYAPTGTSLYIRKAALKDKSTGLAITDMKAALKDQSTGLEITDLNRIYLDNKQLHVELLGQGFTWLDTGTHESLVDATNFVKTIETHQHRKIACLEEIAYRNGWISREEVLETYEILKKNQYGQYLKDVLDGKYIDVL